MLLQGCTISDEWKFRDIETMIMENNDLRVVILTGKGTDISEILYKPLGINILFRNPYGPRNLNQAVSLSPNNQIFRDYTGGGWSDILPNAGAPSQYSGIAFGLHEETPLLRWSSEITESSGSAVSAVFRVNLIRYPFSVYKKITLDDSNRILIQESVSNNSNQDLPFSWLIHPTFSRDFACDGARISIEGKRIHRMSEKPVEWDFPYFTEPDGHKVDFRTIPSRDSLVDDTVVLSGLKSGRYSVLNPKLRLRFTLEWPAELFRYVWYYRNYSSRGYPYYGRSKFIALEPCTSLRSGLSSQVKHGDAVMLEAGRSISASFLAKVELMAKKSKA